MMSCDKIDQSSSIDLVYVATNMAHYATWFELPKCPDLYRWHLSFNTGDLSHVVFEAIIAFIPNINGIFKLISACSSS